MTLLAVALDTDDLARAVAIAEEVAPHADVLKVGLQLFISAGPAAVTRLASIRPVFLDLKLGDIPNTVGRATAAAAATGASYLTVHTDAGEISCSEAAAAARDSGTGLRLLGVTVLTSLDADGLTATGVDVPMDRVLDMRARLAARVGFAGVICAGGDQGLVASSAPALLRVVPGVRPVGSTTGDHERTITPEDAARGGAHMIVVGRPITGAADQSAAALAVRTALELNG